MKVIARRGALFAANVHRLHFSTKFKFENSLKFPKFTGGVSRRAFFATKSSGGEEEGDKEGSEEKIEENTTNKHETEDGKTEMKEKEGDEKEEGGFKMPEMKIPEPREVVSRMYGGILDGWDWAKGQIRLGLEELKEDGGTEKKSGMSTKVSEDFAFTKSSDEDEEGEEKPVYDGPTAVVHVKEQGSAWEQMRERLSQMPIYQALRKQSKRLNEQVGKTTVGKVGKKGVESVQDKIEDAREYWETSQNPLVYAAAGAIENMTGETEEALTVKEIWKVIPGFDHNEFARDIEQTLAPQLIRAHLAGDISPYQKHLGEAVYHKLTADIDARKKDGVVIDPKLLDFEQMEASLRMLEGTGPVILCLYRAQQVHCVRDKDGEIVDGSESDVRAKFYQLIFTVHRVQGDPDEGEEEHSTYAKWKVAEYGFFGDQPYY